MARTRSKNERIEKTQSDSSKKGGRSKEKR